MQPQTIPDRAIPVLDTVIDSVAPVVDPTMPSVNSEDGTQPSTIAEPRLVPPVIAFDTIGISLNTQSRQILGTFTFGQVGALQIGKYVNGNSGEIDITPNGITAKNINGDTTFTLDGTTGNATFKGTIQAGTLISGNIIVGGTGNGDGTIQVLDGSNVLAINIDHTGIIIYNGNLTIQDANGISVIDSQGVISTTQFPNGSVTQSGTQNTNSTGFTDISNTSVSFSLPRTANVLVLFDATGLNTVNSTGGDNCIATINVDGSDQGKQMSLPGMLSDNLSLFGVTASLTYLLQLGAGNHTIKGRFRSVNGNTARITFATVTYNVLGK